MLTPEEAAQPRGRTGIKLTEAEQREFDNITHDAILEIKDVGKLKKMEAYYRQEGYEPTAEACRRRLMDLGQKDPAIDPQARKETEAELAAIRATLKSWTAEQRSMDTGLAAHKTIPSAGRLAEEPVSAGAAYPPVRPPAVIAVEPVSDTKAGSKKGGSDTKKGDNAKKSNDTASKVTADANGKDTAAKQDTNGKGKPDSKFGGQVRSGSDYYRKWDQFADQAEKEVDQDDAAPAAAKVAAPSAANGRGAGDAAQPAATTAGAKGAALTQRKVELNTQLLSEKELVWNSEQEKTKGNEAFRAKEYQQAVEHYTTSLGYRPQNASVHCNRGAAYLKLRMWAEAELDCDIALSLEPAYLKALTRRSVARMELGKHEAALEDIMAGLALDPGNKELQSMRERAEKAVGKPTMKRMAIEEVEDEDEEGEEAYTESATGQQGQAGASTAGAAGGADAAAGQVTRKAIPIVVEDESSSGEEEEGEQMLPPPPQQLPQQQQQQQQQVQQQQVQQAPAPAAPPATPPTPAPQPHVAAAATSPAAAPPPPATPAPVQRQAPVPPSPAQPAPPSPPPAAPQPSIKPLQVEVDELKDEGNRLFKAGNLKGAKDKYSAALALAPDSALLYTNRALTKLKLGDAKGCLGDAALAVALDPTHVKALCKRAHAKRELGMLQGALEDLKYALEQADGRLVDEIKRDIAAVGKDKAERSAKRRAEREAKKAKAAVKEYKRQGVVIEELSDEEDEGAEDSGVAAMVRRMEADAANKAFTVKRKAEELRVEREAAIAAEAEELERRAAAAAAAAQPSPSVAAATAAPNPSQPAASADASASAAAGQQQAAPAAQQPVDRSQQAMTLKDKGRDLFNRGDVGAAVAAWKQALELCAQGGEAVTSDSIAVACHANLALALVKLGDPAGALAHADAVLQVEPESHPTHHKCLHRRALALRDLGRLEEALQGLRAVKRLQGQSAQVDRDIEDVVHRLQTTQGQQKQGGVPAGAGAQGLFAKSVQQPAPLASTQGTGASSSSSSVATPDSASPLTSPASDSGSSSTAGGTAKQAVPTPSQQARSAPAQQQQQHQHQRQSTKVPITIESESSDDEAQSQSPLAAQQAATQQQQQPSPAELAAVAESERKAGNDLFAAGKFEEALACYDRSLAAQPSSSVHSNRALMLLKLGRASEAEKACREALSLDSSNIKARHRLGQSLLKLERAAEAVAELEAVAKQLPRDQTVAAELAKAREGAVAGGPGPRPASATSTSINSSARSAAEQHKPRPASASAAAGTQASGGSRTKIVIEESDGSSEDEKGEILAAAPAKPAAGTTVVSNGTSHAGTSSTSASASSTTASQGRSSTGGSKPASAAQSIQQAAAAKAAAAIANLSQKQRPPPKSAVEFLNACKEMQGAANAEALSEYVRSIEPDQYPSIFKNSLDSVCASHLLRGLVSVAKSDPGFAATALERLSQVPRFAMVYAMLPKPDKAAVAEVLGAVEASGAAEAVPALKKLYKV